MKKAVIIGASSGIGRELAKKLVKNNYQVGIMGRRRGLLDELQVLYPAAIVVKELDVRMIEAIPQALNELAEEMGGLDLLVLSSGTGDLNDNLQFDIERMTIETNVLGFAAVANWAFHYFEKQGSGHLVGISSVAGIRGSRVAPAYNATKSFQINYLEGLRQRAAKLDAAISITDIRPGLVDTAMAKGQGLFWVMPVEKVVDQIYDAIKRKRKVLYVTKRWYVVAQLLRSLPRIVYDNM